MHMLVVHGNCPCLYECASEFLITLGGANFLFRKSMGVVSLFGNVRLFVKKMKSPNAAMVIVLTSYRINENQD